METKKCTKCLETKEVNQFMRRYEVKSMVGYRSHCKDCERKEAKMWRDKNREHRARQQREWVKNNPEKVKQIRANIPRKKLNAVGRIIKRLHRGSLIAGNCIIGKDCNGRIEAHHPDYDKPLEIVWLCKKHHEELHSGFVLIDNIEKYVYKVPTRSNPNNHKWRNK